MTEFYVEEIGDYRDAVMSFEKSEVSFAGGDEYNGFAYTFTAENTKQLYQAMRKYYGDL